MTGHESLYTLIQLWTVWGTFLGVINTAAGGSLMMDCLPSDDEGEPGTTNAQDCSDEQHA